MVDKKADERDCPECKTRMESKGSMTDIDDNGYYNLWQCPKCKNIEILWEDS